MAKTNKTGVRIDYANNTIVLYKWFSEKAQNPANKEFHVLSKYMKNLPGFTVTVRPDIKKNEGQEHYNGLTYDYMRFYINKFEPEETRAKILDKLESKIIISKCHSIRYPAIKNWFLEQYPDVKNFGMPELKETIQEQNTVESKTVLPMAM